MAREAHYRYKSETFATCLSDDCFLFFGRMSMAYDPGYGYSLIWAFFTSPNVTNAGVIQGLCLEKDLANSNTGTQHAIEQVAEAECNQLSHHVITKLPREIRDMIYQHLSTRNPEHIEREHFRTTLDPVTRLYSYDHARWKASHFPDHFWNPRYVGDLFFRELVENYYRNSTFTFGDDPEVMKRFLSTDEMGINILPKDLVRNIEVHLKAVSYDRGSFRGYMFGVPKKPERLQAALDGLSELNEGARICVRFFTEAKTVKERDEHCLAALPTLFSSTQIAKMTGYKVKFVVDDCHHYDLEGAMAQDWAMLHGVV
ncbi:hypothetical protein BKA66DRAFT_556948 [Pyrenochaeta sp. MPI-SDFR-AT-0127]|nr:hypothetical protein BKA66DRAFT_556948 [Pyrenochaeta sp. MPI-SDFR-AT-0127]